MSIICLFILLAFFFSFSFSSFSSSFDSFSATNTNTHTNTAAANINATTTTTTTTTTTSSSSSSVFSFSFSSSSSSASAYVSSPSSFSATIFLDNSSLSHLSPDSFNPCRPEITKKDKQNKPAQSEESFISEKIREIYLEVKGAALVSPEGWREWQSFLGKDEDDTYKDDHLFILIQEGEKGESRMFLQVTKLEREPRNPTVQKARGSKLIEASIKEERVFIARNDFGPEEAKRIFPEILRSIKEKKKILGIKEGYFVR